MPTLIFPATGFSTGTRFLSTTTAAIDLVRVPGLVKSRATLKTPTSNDYFRIPGKLKSNFYAKNPTPNDFVTLTTVTNITTTTSQLTVTPTVKPTTTLGNLYYFNLVPALRQDRYQNRYNAYTYNITGFETVKLGNLQKQIEIIKNPTPRDSVIWLANKIKTNATLKNPTARDAVVLFPQLLSLLKVPFNKTKVFDINNFFGKLKTDATLKNPAPNDAVIWDVNNLQKQIEIIKNPTPRDGVVLFPQLLSLLKVPTKATEVFDIKNFYGNLQKQIEIIKNPAPNDAIIWNVNKIKTSATLKTPTPNSSVISLPGRLKSAFTVRPPSPTASIMIRDVLLINTTTSKATVTLTVSPTAPLENLYYFTLAPAIREDRYQNRYNAFTLNNIGGIEVTRATSVINTLTLKSTVSPTVKPTSPLGNLYFFTLAPAIREDRYQNRYNAYTFNISGFETVKSGNLQKQLEIIKNPTPNDFRSYSSPIITQSKTSQLNTEVFILQPDGMLARFKTGAGHGNDITDPNFVPQAPIQFWN